MNMVEKAVDKTIRKTAWKNTVKELNDNKHTNEEYANFLVDIANEIRNSKEPISFDIVSRIKCLGVSVICKERDNLNTKQSELADDSWADEVIDEMQESGDIYQHGQMIDEETLSYFMDEKNNDESRFIDKETKRSFFKDIEELEEDDRK